MIAEQPITQGLDVENRRFIAQSGQVFNLLELSPLILERMYADTTGRPTPPLVEVTIGDLDSGGFTRKEENPHDPAYLQALERWDIKHTQEVLRYQFNKGVRESPPQEFLDEYKMFFQNANSIELKYLWVLSRLNYVEYTALSEAIMSQVGLTQAGIAVAESIFPS